MTGDELARLAAALGWTLGEPAADGAASLARTTPLLQDLAFSTHHAEHEMLRFLKRLENRDVALTHGMIPLGSCTMKLNATAEMLAVSLPGFADLHPFAPAAQTEGFLTLIGRLSGWLARPPASPPCRCSPTPAARASTRGCSPSAPITPPAARRPATSA